MLVLCRQLAALLDDRVDVRLDRLRTDDELLADATVRKALGHELENLALARRQLVERALVALAAEELGDDLRIDRCTWSHDGFLDAYARYVVVGAIVAGVTVVLLAGFVEDLGLHPRPAQALALTLLVPLSFVLSKRFAFRPSPNAAQGIFLLPSSASS